MTIPAETTEKKYISSTWIVFGALAVVIFLGWFLGRMGERPLKPIRPTASPAAFNYSSQPVIVTFEELNADPAAFRNQRIRVSGSFAPQPKPDCFVFKGPVIRWALVNEDLQLNGMGFELVLKLVPAGTVVTVEGIWRLYDGPFGCGKGPVRGQVWYLQAEQIIEPNPLPIPGVSPAPGEPGLDDTPSPEAQTETPASETATAVPTQPPLATLTPFPGGTAIPTPGATATGFTPTPNSTATIINTPPTRTPFTATSSPPATTSTPSGSATATLPVPTTTGTPNPTAPPLPTTTPGPSSTPGPSPTPDNYPPPPTAYP